MPMDGSAPMEEFPIEDISFEFRFNLNSLNLTNIVTLIIDHNLDELDWKIPIKFDNNIRNILIDSEADVYKNIPTKLELKNIPLNGKRDYNSSLIAYLDNKNIEKKVNITLYNNLNEVGSICWKIKNSKFLQINTGIFKIDKKPKLDEAKLNEAKLKEPKLDAPKLDEVKLDAPKLDEAKLNKPKLDEAKLKEPKLDAPKLGKPKLDEPKLDAPKLNELKLGKPKLDEPKLDEPKMDIPTSVMQFNTTEFKINNIKYHFAN